MNHHGLNVHVIAYVQNGGNLSTMTFTLTLVMSCAVLGLPTPFCKDLLGPHDVQMLLVCHR